MLDLKTCNACGNEFPATVDYFNRYTNGKMKSQCRECTRQKSKEWREKNKEKSIEYRKKYYQDNKEYYQNHNKQWKKENEEHMREYKREYGRKYYEKNKLKLSEYRKQRRISSGDYFNIVYQQRRAKFKRLPNTLTIAQWDKIKEYFNNECAYCGMSEAEHLEKWQETIHQEHFISLSKGGEYTHNNIIPACRSCNSSKNNSDFFEWYKQNENFDIKRQNKILSYLSYTTEDTQQLSIL